jgi:1,4-dihydroxy-6-naphthoate synthase
VDIETLNKRAFNNEIDVTALSAHSYAFLHDKYRILSTGASVGDGYGPVVVGNRENMSVEGKKIAVPGEHTINSLPARCDFLSCNMLMLNLVMYKSVQSV